jgi:hypothetical protein
MKISSDDKAYQTGWNAGHPWSLKSVHCMQLSSTKKEGKVSPTLTCKTLPFPWTNQIDGYDPGLPLALVWRRLLIKPNRNIPSLFAHSH